ncbi:DUF262 domain-containing protein [Bradyrhizobium yuanmingense]|uniref:DUF262 domain-containing protein n=1 Tax=Bradyrhizobium yuanmingense TaxID=108015 RepID=UPI003517A879
MKITPTSLTLNQLFGSTNEQYVIPTYQRRYSWHERQVGELMDDIAAIENGDTHLLGSIVCLAGHHKAGLNHLELVDGQQRLTTVSIILECIRERLEAEGTADETFEIDQLLNAKPLSGKTVKKIALESIDADEFAQHLLQGEVAGAKNQNLAGAFSFVRERVADASLKDVREFLYMLRNHAVIIRLDVGNAKDAFKLFETINNRGLKLSPTDIVKNFLLGNAARLGSDSLEFARKHWSKLLVNLDGTSSDAFFRYFLMATLQRRVMTSEVIAEFKSLFMNQVKEAETLPEHGFYNDPEDDQDEDAAITDAVVAEVPVAQPPALKKVGFNEFVSRLTLCSEVYGDLIFARTKDKRIDRHLRNLQMIKAVQTYGFLMHLRSNGCSDKDFREILKLTENFVLRRHVCRERSNDTEALFARLCANSPKNPIESTKVAYRELCPTDDKFRAEFADAHFSANLIDRARYCLEKIEIAKHGEHDELQVLGSDDVHVEHIMPQKIKTKKAKDEYGDWVSYLGNNAESAHSRYVDRIGNLTLFAGPLNIGASNNPFGRKKTAYKDSAIKLTQDLAKLSNFRFSNIDSRSKSLAEIAVSLWPRP